MVTDDILVLGMKTLRCKMWCSWEEGEHSWGLNLVVEQGLEEEF